MSDQTGRGLQPADKASAGQLKIRLQGPIRQPLFMTYRLLLAPSRSERCMRHLSGYMVYQVKDT
jgi:hypothetical protein